MNRRFQLLEGRDGQVFGRVVFFGLVDLAKAAKGDSAGEFVSSELIFGKVGCGIVADRAPALFTVKVRALLARVDDDQLSKIARMNGVENQASFYVR